MAKVVSGGVRGGRAYPSYPADAPLKTPLKNPAAIVPPTIKINHSADENALFLTVFSACILRSPPQDKRLYYEYLHLIRNYASAL